MARNKRVALRRNARPTRTLSMIDQRRNALALIALYGSASALFDAGAGIGAFQVLERAHGLGRQALAIP